MPPYPTDSSEEKLKAEIHLFQKDAKEGMKKDWDDGSVGKGFAEQASGPEFESLEPM